MNINYTKLCLLIMACTVCYNEYLSYWVSHVSWPRLPSLDTVPGAQVTMLMVADPQIVGNIHEPSGVLGSVQRWDCDRYLAKSYAWALSSYPDISTVIFMGDLIDEGSEADDEMFADYAERFHGLYPAREGVSMVYIPGDNDIGGEGADPVTINKMDRFDKHFGPVKAVHAASDNIDIVPVSRLTEHGVYNLTLKPAQLYTTKIVVAVSHVPVLPLNGKFSERVMNLVNPDLIFSAHDHQGYLFTADRETRHMKGDIRRFSRREESSVAEIHTRTPVLAEDTELGVGRLTGDIVEVVVPTTSYRMGVPNMGLGVVTISSAGDAVFANLWLPGRFSLLYSYGAMLIVVAVIFVVGKLLDIKRLCRRREEYSADARRKYESILRL